MKIALELPDQLVETIVKDIMANFPEASSGCGLQCVGWKYDAWRFTFEDTEDVTSEWPMGRSYVLDKAKLLATFPLVFTAWPKGCTQPPMTADEQAWDDWLCQCDATDFDAFAQLACFGEVIYG